jgi:hypothetical protein
LDPRAPMDCQFEPLNIGQLTASSYIS